ncbi:MAG: hypothetical protein LC679_08585 [Intrasporangiaceae bacterium]|nr:hypothetical protein [Intrasporangiaceae bacterium]
MSVTNIQQAILDGAPGERIAELPLPETMRAAVVRKAEVDHFDGVATEGRTTSSGRTRPRWWCASDLA